MLLWISPQPIPVLDGTIKGYSFREAIFPWMITLSKPDLSGIRGKVQFSEFAMSQLLAASRGARWCLLNVGSMECYTKYGCFISLFKDFPYSRRFGCRMALLSPRLPELLITASTNGYSGVAHIVTTANLWYQFHWGLPILQREYPTSEICVDICGFATWHLHRYWGNYQKSSGNSGQR